MGRRGVLSKMVFPPLSWVAVMRLLKKAPKNFPAFAPAMGAEMAITALLGCRAAPHTHSLRYTDDFSACVSQRQHRRSRRPKPAILSGCSSRPHTDSFRVHHVVNQEALQLMLTFGDDDAADFDHEAFFESEELWYGIIRDGDRLLRDDIYTDESMRTCSSSLSAAASSSLTGSAASFAALSQGSVHSEGLYSTANSASFGYAPSTPELLNAGSHISCDSRPSSSIISSCDVSELIFNDANLDHDLKLEAREEAELAGVQEEEVAAELGVHEAEEDADLDMYGLQDQTSTRAAAIYGEIGAVQGRGAGNELHEDDAAGEADDEEEEEEAEGEVIVAEMRYSEDPLEDFVEAISRIVVRQQLNKAAQLQELYWRFLRLNAPCHHHTIELAFLHALQRLASFDPHLLHTLL